MGGENSAFKALPNHRIVPQYTASSPGYGYSSSDSEEINVNDHTDDEEETRNRLLSLQQRVQTSPPSSPVNGGEDDEKAEPLQLTKHDRERI